MLTNLEIADLAQRMRLPFVGCFNKNELPRHFETGKTYIINIQDSHDENNNALPGSHWTAFMLIDTPSKRVPFYFDSFGLGPPAELDRLIRKQMGKKTKIAYSTKQIQHKDVSAACGWFSLAWAHFMSRGGDGRFFRHDLFERYADFVDLFDAEQLQRNDDILRMFFQERPAAGVAPPADTSVEASEASS